MNWWVMWDDAEDMCRRLAGILPASRPQAPAGWRSRLRSGSTTRTSCLWCAIGATVTFPPVFSCLRFNKKAFECFTDKRDSYQNRAMQYETRFCPPCNAGDDLPRRRQRLVRLRCPACEWTHWNNPTPVLAAIVEIDGKVLLARNAVWPAKMFALITGFMEAGESPQEGIAA